MIGAVIKGDGKTAVRLVETVYSILTDRTVRAVNVVGETRAEYVPHYARATASSTVRNAIKARYEVQSTVLPPTSETMSAPNARELIARHRAKQQWDKMVEPDHYVRAKEEAAAQMKTAPAGASDNRSRESAQPDGPSSEAGVEDAVQTIDVAQANVVAAKQNGDVDDERGGRAPAGAAGHTLEHEAEDGGYRGAQDGAGGDMIRFIPELAESIAAEYSRKTSVSLIEHVLALSLGGIEIKGLDLIRTFGSVDPSAAFMKGCAGFPENVLIDILDLLSGEIGNIAALIVAETVDAIDEIEKSNSAQRDDAPGAPNKKLLTPGFSLMCRILLAGLAVPVGSRVYDAVINTFAALCGEIANINASVGTVLLSSTWIPCSCPLLRGSPARRHSLIHVALSFLPSPSFSCTDRLAVFHEMSTFVGDFAASAPCFPYFCAMEPNVSLGAFHLCVSSGKVPDVKAGIADVRNGVALIREVALPLLRSSSASVVLAGLVTLNSLTRRLLTVLSKQLPPRQIEKENEADAYGVDRLGIVLFDLVFDVCQDLLVIAAGAGGRGGADGSGVQPADMFAPENFTENIRCGLDGLNGGQMLQPTIVGMRILSWADIQAVTLQFAIQMLSLPRWILLTGRGRGDAGGSPFPMHSNLVLSIAFEIVDRLMHVEAPHQVLQVGVASLGGILDSKVSGCLPAQLSALTKRLVCCALVLPLPLLRAVMCGSVPTAFQHIADSMPGQTLPAEERVPGSLEELGGSMWAAFGLTSEAAAAAGVGYYSDARSTSLEDQYVCNMGGDLVDLQLGQLGTTVRLTNPIGIVRGVVEVIHENRMTFLEASHVVVLHAALMAAFPLSSDADGEQDEDSGSWIDLLTRNLRDFFYVALIYDDLAGPVAFMLAVIFNQFPEAAVGSIPVFERSLQQIFAGEPRISGVSEEVQVVAARLLLFLVAQDASPATKHVMHMIASNVNLLLSGSERVADLLREQLGLSRQR